MRYTPAIAIALVLITQSVYAITVNPSSYTTSVQTGIYDTVNFHIFNNENTTVNVTISIDAPLQGKISFTETSFSIQPNSTHSVTAVISRTSPIDGYIHFNNIAVRITVSQNQTPPPQNQTQNITLIPSTPIAGKNLIFLLPNENAIGYIYIKQSNNVYVITMTNGIGIISLKEEDFGDATIVIYGKKVYTKSIFINPPSVESLYIAYPLPIKTGDEIVFKVYADGNPVQAKLKFDGADNFTIKTNSLGEATVKFSKAGNYTITTTYFDKILIKTISVYPKPIKIQLPEEIYANTAFQISTEPNAKITIQMGDAVWSYTANSDGVCTFTPPFSGKYKITAKTEDKEGSTSFFVKTNTHIVALGEDGTQINKLKIGDVVMLQVLTSEDKPITNSRVDIYIDGIFHKTCSMIGGFSLWKVDKDGNIYEFRYIPDSDEYISSSLTISGEKTTNYLMLIAICIIVAVLIGFLYYANQKGWLKKGYKDLF